MGSSLHIELVLEPKSWREAGLPPFPEMPRAKGTGQIWINSDAPAATVLDSPENKMCASIQLRVTGGKP